MSRTHSSSATAQAAADLVEALQRRFAAALERLGEDLGAPTPWTAIEWLRDEGRHGGGMRLAAAESGLFNRAAINVSQVHYDDDPQRKLGSASALSTIIHPAHPRAPSVHIHISWTERKDGTGYWRLMADLNPAIPDPEAAERFAAAVREVAPELYAEASAQGDRYFQIPALGRHRGVTHYYLEGYTSDDLAADEALATAFGEAAIDRYVEILAAALADAEPPTPGERAEQLAYHTAYLFQVLTLDRGTTSGLLVHDQNDVGILGSLPAFVDRGLLASWEPEVPTAQRELVRVIVEAIPEPVGAVGPSPVTDEVRARLAAAVREFYRAHPEALALQASGGRLPPTLDNHRVQS